MFNFLKPKAIPINPPVPQESALPEQPGDFVFGVRRSGAHVLPFITSEALLHRERELIFSIRLAADLTYGLWEDAGWPLIRRLARLVSSLPASEGMHDADAGGLFRHSLTVALYALNALKSHTTNFEDDDSRRLGLLMACLSHDVLKTVTDFRVSVTGGEVWDPLLCDLEDFMTARHATSMTVDFISGRGMEHALYPALRTLLLTRDGTLKIWSCMQSPALCEDFIEGTHPMWALVRQADGYSVSRARSRTASRINVTDFMRAGIFSMIAKGDFPSNTPEAEIFTCREGVILGYAGDAYLAFRKRFKDLFKDERGRGEHFGVYLRRSGLATMYGQNRYCSWYRIECGGSIVYMKAVLLKTALPPDQQLCQAVERTYEPYEIAEILKESLETTGRPLRAFALPMASAPLSGCIPPELVDPASRRYLDEHDMNHLDRGEKEIPDEVCEPTVPSVKLNPEVFGEDPLPRLKKKSGSKYDDPLPDLEKLAVRLGIDVGGGN